MFTVRHLTLSFRRGVRTCGDEEAARRNRIGSPRSQRQLKTLRGLMDPY